jgi:hypothetical protein
VLCQQKSRRHSQAGSRISSPQPRGFLVMAKNLDMREVLAEEGTDMNELPDCVH